MQQSRSYGPAGDAVATVLSAVVPAAANLRTDGGGNGTETASDTTGNRDAVSDDGGAGSPGGSGDGGPPGAGGPGGDDDGLLAGLLGSKLSKVVVVAVAATVIIGAAAGAFLLLSDDSGNAHLDKVPSGVDSVSYVDVDEIAEDRAIGQVVNKMLSFAPEDSDSPEDYEALQAELSNETGLSVDDLHSATSFSKYNETTGMGASEYSGVVVDADWTAEELVTAVENDSTTDLEESEYGGATVYKPADPPEFGTSSWLAVLSDGLYVFGSPDAVKDVVDVSNGDADAMSGELKTAFENTRSGYIKTASRVPERQIPGDTVGSSGVNTSDFQKVTVVTGAYYTDGNTLGVTTTMQAEDESAARDIEDVTSGSVSLARGLAELDEVKETLQKVEVERDGDRVTVTYEESVENVNSVLEAWENQSMEDQEPPIQASADVEPDPTDDEVEVVWVANQNADYLEVEYTSSDGEYLDSATLTGVGDAHTFQGQDGTSVEITVTAWQGGRSTVVYQGGAEL